MTNSKKEIYNWRGEAFRWGIFAGAICVSLFAGIYFTNKEWIFNSELWYGSMVIYILAMWKTQSLVESDEMKNYIQPGFLVYVVANALFYIYSSTLFTRIDPELPKVYASLMDRIRDNGNEAFLLPVIRDFSLFAYMQSLLIGFCIAAIIGFILKNKTKS